jgi:transposase
MSNLAVYAGLDYSDKAIQVCVLDAQGRQLGNRLCVNSGTALADYVGRFGYEVHAAIESGTGAAHLAEELVQRYGWSVDLGHPGFVARMKQNPDKSDFQDARLLADLERVGYLPRVWLAPENVRELRRLVHYRQHLIKQQRATKLRLRALLRDQRCRPTDQLNPWTKAWRCWLLQVAAVSEQSRYLIGKYVAELDRLVADIRDVEQRLEQLTAQDEVVRALRAQAGIGPVTAWTMRAAIGRFDRFRNGKQLARFCGLSPRNASSGQRQADAGLIRAADPELRAVLIEAAHRLMRLQPQWQILATRLRQAGKKASVVAAAVGNRWVRWLFHQMQPQMAACG